MSESDLYTIGEVAAILGVSAHTIRAWERRHGMVHPQRTRARQRRYRGEDVELLRDVKRAIDIKGLSLKLAFQAVTGGQQPVETPTSRTRPKRSEQWPLPSDIGVWHAVADVLPQLIMIVDLDGKILEANVATAKTFGTVRQRLTGRSFAELVDPFDRSKAVLLYRSQPRTVKGWELNLATQHGARLYSFQCWPVRQGGETSLALVGSEMFGTPLPRSTGTGRRAGDRPGSASVSDHTGEQPTANTFQTLVDQLPFGVAVTTIGPQPRVVYANGRLPQTLGVSPGVLTGRPLNELVHDDAAGHTLREVVATRAARTLRGVADGAASEANTPRRYFNLGFRPLFSSSRKVTSVLVVVEDATTEVAERLELEKLVADHRFERAKTVQQLAHLGLEHLATLVPHVDFVIALGRLSDAAGALSIVASTPGWRASASDLTGVAIGDAMRRAADRGTTCEVKVMDGPQSFQVTAVPLGTSRSHGAKRKLGVVAWRRPADDPLALDQRHTVDAFVARLAFAIELLHLRAQAARSAARLEAVVTAASVVRTSGGQTGLGIKFLERLTDATGADGAAIGRVVGSDFVLEAAYAPGGAHARPGDRFPLAGHFVSESVRTGKPTGTSRISSAGLPEPIKKALAPMKHGLSVPLVLDGRVVGVVTLVRTSHHPFNEEDVVLVQTLSSVALLAVTLGRRDSSPD